MIPIYLSEVKQHLAFQTANKILRKVNDYNMYVNKLHRNKENSVTAEFDVKFLGITIDNKHN